MGTLQWGGHCNGEGHFNGEDTAMGTHKFPDSNGLYVLADQVCHPDRAGLKELTLHVMQMKNQISLWTRMEQATEGSPVHLVQALSTDG